MMCSRCKKNIAVVFVTKIEGEKQSNEGLCITCAKELGIEPVNQMMGHLGIDEEELMQLSKEMTQIYENDLTQSDKATQSPFDVFNKLFDNISKPNDKNSINDENSTAQNVKTQTQEKKSFKKKKFLDTYGTNLINLAKNGKIDRVIGREAEIERVVQILNRRTKNNPVLLGEPGVGKTAIAEGLALRITQKNVPAKLLNYEIYLLDFTAIVAGTQFRGQFEARLKNIIEEAVRLSNVILVIDEIHNIVAAGDAEGAMSAANILKPALAKGELQIIGATTLTEYRKHIEKDSALERRLQTVIVDEPSIQDTIEIIKGIKDYYENYHHIKISDDIIRLAVELSERYITDRYLPDKAIDVIDEAGSFCNLKNQTLVELEKLNFELKSIQTEKENAVSADSIEDYQKAADLKIKECKLLEEITKTEKKCKKITLTENDIAGVIEKWTKIPVSRITEIESKRLISLEDRIKIRLIGQENAVACVSKAIRRKRAGLERKRKPVSFIFVGPTGVGKTELAKILAYELFDSDEALIRLDMSEYMEKHSVSKIIGAPPGYVGYDDAGQLTEKIRRKPYSIILLDEIEKAHPDVFNILLQILDDGRITDSHGKQINFENTIIIMTSNAGSDQKQGNFGFTFDSNVKIASKVDSALKEIFRPEFLNRVDEIIVFNELNDDEILKIVDIMLQDLKNELIKKNIEIDVSVDAKKYIMQKGFDKKYGARPLKRAIQKEIEDKLAEKIIKNEIGAGSFVKIDCIENEIVLG